jgi:hypothetical protein
VAATGGVYIDLWEALADERGQYSAFGPDINGQIVKLRAADGIHLTEAGGLNIAHFVANEVKKLHEGHRPAEPAPMATAPEAGSQPQPPGQPGDSAVANAPANNAAPLVFQSPVPAPATAPALPERPAIGPIQTLTGPPSGTEAAELARRAPAAVAPDAQALARHVFVEGGDQPARANRADDHSWKPPAH